MSQHRRPALVAVLVALVLAVVAAGCGSDSTTSQAQSGPANVTIKDAKPVGGVQKFSYNKGDTIDLVVKSDTADEIHFHGYDVHRDVKAGGTAQFKIPANIEGRFVVELEHHGEQIAEVTVNP